jgi:hypothetical protein
MLRPVFVLATVLAVAAVCSTNTYAEEPGTITFDANNPVWPATTGPGKFVDAAVHYTLSAGYTATNLRVACLKVTVGAGGVRTYSELGYTDSPNPNGSGSHSEQLINKGTYLIRVTLSTIKNNMMQPNVVIDSADKAYP